MKILLLVLLLLVPAIQAMPGDIAGTIYNVTETKGIYINITESRYDASGFLNANLPLFKERALTGEQMSTYGLAAWLLAELLGDGGLA